MSNIDRLLLTLILASAFLLALREVDFLSRQKSCRPDIVVSVTGAVLRPSVLRLPPDARTVHAIDRCGGLLAQADREAVELAKGLKDGEHLVVPLRATIVAELSEPVACGPDFSPGGPPPREGHDTARPGVQPPQRTGSRRGQTAPSRSEPSGPVNVNLASADELDALPGVGPVLAERIVAARQAAPGGTFSSLEELGSIRGIKGKTLLRLKPYLKIEGS